jgi:exopolysaccharide biosynthesis polyprenyl glycosylphosphotransferase
MTESFFRDPLLLIGLGIPLFLGAVVALRRARPRSSPYRAAAKEQRVLVLGGGALARAVIDVIETSGSRWTVAGVLADSWGTDEPSPFPLMGSLHDLEAIVRRIRPDRIVVALGERRGRLPVEALLEARARGITVEDGVAVYERLTGKLAIEALWPSALLYSKGLRPRRIAALLARLMSLAVGVLGLAGTLPAFPLIALAIRLDSEGPVFFVQERVGLFGRRFGLVKFRTMSVGGRNGSEWIRDNAARVTRVGRWLRRLHLDELPQFVNCLRGDMNLVGPRPHPASNFEMFNFRIPYYSLRASVRPGLTGWAQIRYGYANTLEEETEKMRYDLWYIKHRSLWLDLGILAHTARGILSGHGTEAVAAEHGTRPFLNRAKRARASGRVANRVA